MKVELTNRAIRDLREISDYSRRVFRERVTAAHSNSAFVMWLLASPTLPKARRA
jgi:hypothetical protein